MSPINACLLAVMAFEKTLPPTGTKTTRATKAELKTTFLRALRSEFETVATVDGEDFTTALRFLNRELEVAGYVGD